MSDPAWPVVVTRVLTGEPSIPTRRATMSDVYTELKELEELLRRVGDQLLASALKLPPGRTRDQAIGAANGFKASATFAFTAAEANKPQEMQGNG